MARTLYYELHIRPLFRQIDRQHMLGIQPELDLWSYDSLASADDNTGELWRVRVLQEAGATDPFRMMPPPDNSGPWPDEWLTLYKRWLDSGAKQLPRATAATMKVKKQQGSFYSLDVTGTKKGNDYMVWLDIVPGREEPPVFIVYEQPPEAGVPPTQATFSVSEFFEAKGAKTVRLIDASGPHDVPIPP